MYTNKLIEEKSPYLLQHAHNPVDWHPWGESAFEQAQVADKPIFLSVGYSTCHWCHVMERESFESEEIARLLNEHFVPIKVDREERPDVDRIYMSFVQASTGGGGWPMSVWLTPDLKPFYGGTYFPPTDAYGRPGFKTVLERLAEAWQHDRERVVESSDKVLAQLREHVNKETSGAWLDESVLDSGFHIFRRLFDARKGGFGGPPKFPRPVTHNFLLRYHARTGAEEALDMVLKTLREMAAGGMNEQLGGGFHRYSVDAEWFVPHFEKMLYDQAQLVVSYVEAYQITGEEFFAETAHKTCNYVLEQLAHPAGAFYSAEDADSVIDPADPKKKGEGAFYIWRHDEIVELLGQPAAEWFCYRYGVLPHGNVSQANDPHGEFADRNILYLARTVEQTAREFGVEESDVAEALSSSSATLLQARAKRIRPHLDDKILSAWNGLMISALAVAAQALDEARYLDAARRAADFILTEMYDPTTGSLQRRHRDGETAIDGFLDDYAFLANALIDLYEASFEWRYLETSVALAGELIKRFTDTHKGGFFSTAEGSSDLVLRLKDDYDGAEPSGNSLAVQVLLRLAQLTGRTDFRQLAEKALEHFSATLKGSPVSAPQMLVALDFVRSIPKQIIVAGEPGDESTRALLRATRRQFIPHRLVLLADEASRERLAQWQPTVRDMRPANGKPAAYVCQNFTCQLPVTSLTELEDLLQ